MKYFSSNIVNRFSIHYSFMRGYSKLLISIFLLRLFVISPQANAQEEKKSSRQKNFTRDSIPELDLRPDSMEETASKRKKKLKKKVFYGMKCKKGWTKKGKGDKRVIETFFYLKEFKMPDPYIKDLYVYDFKEKKILEVDEITESDKNKYKILHGPYKKTVGKDIAEQGVYFTGMKHARWERFGKNFVLLDKTKYFKGWQKEAEITYYDAEKKKIKEVLPYKFKTLNGTYYYFLENGQILHHGKYKDGVKVGIWVEYFEDRNKRKKEIRYPNDPYKGEQFEPQTWNEWNDKGDPIMKLGKPFNPAANIRKARRPGKK